jgi:EAL domain-containing protein (putative c-di-GMP-specific phosphodiesterase class I)
LTIEITESTLMADPAQAMEIVRRLSAMGVNIGLRYRPEMDELAAAA